MGVSRHHRGVSARSERSFGPQGVPIGQKRTHRGMFASLALAREFDHYVDHYQSQTASQNSNQNSPVLLGVPHTLTQRQTV